MAETKYTAPVQISENGFVLMYPVVQVRNILNSKQLKSTHCTLSRVEKNIIKKSFFVSPMFERNLGNVLTP